MAWPWNNQGIASPNLDVTPNQQQYLSGTDWRSQMQPMSAWGNTQSAPVDYSNYEDLIMNPEHMPNRLQNLERFADNRFEGGNEDVPGMGRKAIDYIDSPVNFMMRENHPRRFDPLVNAKNFVQELPGNIKKGFKLPGIFGGILGGLKDKFQYRGATEEAWDPQTGQMLSAEEQDKQNALGGYYSPAAKHARLQEKRVMRMLARKEAGKTNFSQTNLDRLQGLGYGPQEKIKPPITPTITAQGDQVNTGGGGSQQTFTQTSPAGISQAQSRAARGGQGPRGTGAMSGWKLAQGGRAGYLFGDRVEQETDFIQGPQGGEEFQETVVEGPEQPSREQLEALAMEIFQLPLEELDEQQLLVVYQEAMQGQPMEEDVQEEDVQFAAQGGLASLL